MITAGIDAGSRAVKAALYDSDRQNLIAVGIVDQGINQDELAESLLDDVLEGAGLTRNDLGPVIATGYGRDSIEIAAETVTEITCHATGVKHLMPGCRTVIDIGGQDSKLIRLKETGQVRDFVMNDRCAAGTGRFLEVVADRLELELADLGEAAEKAEAPAPISSMCVVFAETEIIGLLASDETPSNIVAGVQASIASRISSMAGRHLESPIVFTGGVALITGMKEAIESHLKHEVTIVNNPQFTGALGAALLAADIVIKDN